MSIESCPINETVFFLDDIACAHLVRGILREKLSSGSLTRACVSAEDYEIIEMTDNEFCALLAGRAVRETLPDSFFSGSDLSDLAYNHNNLDLCYINDFDGNIETNVDVRDVESDGRITQSLSEKCIVFQILDKESSLFRPAYSSVEEVVDEVKSKIGAYFPADFDYVARICDIKGTTFG